MIQIIEAEPITDPVILNKTYTYEEMHEAFNAGINRGTYIASIINKKPFDVPFPYWSAFIKVLVNEPHIKQS